MLIGILIALYVIIALSVVVSLLINGVRPSKTLAWLLAIFTIPVGGFLLYLMLGRNRRKNKLFSLKSDFYKKLEPSKTYEQVSDLQEYQKIIQLIQETSQCPVTQQNQVTLLQDGKATFEEIFDALEDAQDHIHLQYYIFEEGVLSERLMDIFERKVAESVTIRLLYDGIGSYSLSKKYLKRLKKIGVKAEQFLPFRFGRFLSSLNYRNHRKIIVVDNKVGFTGGINVTDKYLREDPYPGKWHDTHLKIDGEATHFLNQIFLTDWYLATEEDIDLSQFKIEGTINKGTPVQIASSGPDDDFAVMEQVYFSIINSAKKYIYITNPYVIPNDAIMQSLQTASLSGVDVRLLMSATTDIKLVDWCVRAYFESYLKAGIKIYLYTDGFLHSKIMACDDKIASIGTANLDNRSFQHNYESNAVLYDADLCKQLKKEFFEDCKKSTLLDDHEAFNNRPWWDKLLEGMAKLLSPLL
ncbi:cardiolipin synthase [Muricauda sp. JGD-17]|uniref:Cardiolipin synthase n=1 Tax=Flagellimonas ochracea TaxID=2696472 RepID=A0A964WYC2_9FLAO|nr:cardiolipin synthase [Allomuricauda ochracea]NAY92424.1 cardiolipin synthase [Allomuricauda ochracea]